MKKLFTLLAFLITLTISAQAPQGFNYQATVRNNVDALMINKNVTFKFNVMKDTPTSMPVFSETHYVPTDDLGAVNLVIGKGTATSGTFDNGSSGLPNTNVKYGVGFDTYGKNYGIYPDILPKTEWNHIVCVKKSNGYDYFINNQKYTLPFNMNNVSKTDLNSALLFGIRSGGYAVGNFNGYLDDIAIYNRALTQSEITALYNYTGN